MGSRDPAQAPALQRTVNDLLAKAEMIILCNSMTVTCRPLTRLAPFFEQRLCSCKKARIRAAWAAITSDTLSQTSAFGGDTAPVARSTMNEEAPKMKRPDLS